MRRRSNRQAIPGRRVLCLGNELLADDALGWVVAEQCKQLGGESVTYTSATGFDLLDHLLDVSDLFVVDTIQTGAAEAGTIHVFQEEDLHAASGPSPHYVGLLETLALGRQLGLSVPKRVVIVAVEMADSLTIGGAMHAAVRAAVPVVVGLVHRFLDTPLQLPVRSGKATGGRSRDAALAR
jgi:hydrogenase maturation protease